jgi:hypothetical protein
MKRYSMRRLFEYYCNQPMAQRRCARKHLSTLISLCLSLSTISLSAKGAEFSHERDLPPLTLAATDLDNVLLKAQSLIAAANGPPGEQDYSIRESVMLGVRGKEIEIPHFSLASSVAFPRVIFKFAYSYSRPNMPISSFTVDLGDSARRVSASGKAADQVALISKLAENDLLRHSTWIGGATFRRLAGMSLSVLLLISLIVSSVYCWNTRRYGELGMPVCSALGLLLLFLVPWERYLPGFALYQSYSPFFLIRHAPQIALLSLIATLAGIPLSFLLPRWRRKA